MMNIEGGLTPHTFFKFAATEKGLGRLYLPGGAAAEVNIEKHKEGIGLTVFNIELARLAEALQEVRDKGGRPLQPDEIIGVFAYGRCLSAPLSGILTGADLYVVAPGITRVPDAQKPVSGKYHGQSYIDSGGFKLHPLNTDSIGKRPRKPADVTSRNMLDRYQIKLDEYHQDLKKYEKRLHPLKDVLTNGVPVIYNPRALSRLNMILKREDEDTFENESPYRVEYLVESDSPVERSYKVTNENAGIYIARGILPLTIRVVSR